MASGEITQPVNVDDLFWKPGDSFTINTNNAQWPCVCQNLRELRWTIPLIKPVRSDVASITLSGSLAVRASGKGQTSLNDITVTYVRVTACGLFCFYAADVDVVNSRTEVVNLSPLSAVTVTFS